jgi:hypothetical protein
MPLPAAPLCPSPLLLPRNRLLLCTERLLLLRLPGPLLLGPRLLLLRLLGPLLWLLSWLFAPLLPLALLLLSALFLLLRLSLRALPLCGC